MNAPVHIPDKPLVMDNLAFLGAAADVWMFAGVLGWFLAFFLALEGGHLSTRRSLDPAAWQGAAAICLLQVVRGVEGLLHFSLGPFVSPYWGRPLNLAVAALAATVLLLIFRRLPVRPGRQVAVLLAGLAVLAADVGFALVATNGWSPEGLVEAPHPVQQAITGIGGQIVLAWLAFGFLFWQTQALRISARRAGGWLLPEAVCLVATIAITFAVCRRLYDQAIQGQHSRDLDLARSAVLALPVDQVLQLRGVPEDAETMQFAAAHRALTRFREANPQIEDIYLWIIRQNDFVTLADSSRRDQDYMPPGLVFEKASAWDHNIYRSPGPWLYGPFRDNWGTYVCVNERIVIPGTNELFCWLGIDFETKHWLKSFADGRLLVMASAALMSLMLLVMHNYRLRARDDLALERDKQRGAEQERIRVGRDLHDGLGQLLSAVNIQSSILAGSLAANEPAAARSRALCDLAQRAVEFTRELAQGLVPESWDGGDFRETFERFCQKTARELNTSCEVEVRARELRLPGELATVLVRVTQEAMNNAVRHGKAGRIDIRLTASSGRLNLRIKDDGRGAPPHNQGEGIGISVMRTRIEELGGTFSLKMNARTGVVVECSLSFVEAGHSSGR